MIASSDRWVSFDCFGTLVDWHAGYRHALEPYAGPRTAALVGAYNDSETAFTVAGQAFLSYKEVLRRTVLRAAAAVGVELGDEDAGALARRWGELPVFADTGPALAALRQQGWKLAVLTNCDEDLFARTLEALPVRPDHVVTSERVRSYKPGLAHFETFARETGAAPGRWVHVAEGWASDIAPARGLGVARVWVNRNRSNNDASAATRVLPDLQGLTQVVTDAAGSTVQS